MSAVAAPPEPGKARRGARKRPRVDVRALGGLMLVASPALYVLALLIGPVVLIGLYSVNLASNLKGVPLEFDLTNWEAFLFGADNPFRARFFASLLITLRGLGRRGAGRVSAGLLPRLRGGAPPLHDPARDPRAVLHQLPAADRRVAGHPVQQRRRELAAVGARAARAGERDRRAHLLELRRRPGAVLRVGAVRRAAHLRGARQHGPQPDRGRARPRRRPAVDVLARDAAAEPAGRRLGLRLRADPDHGRVHRAAARGRAAEPDVRQLDPDVLRRHAELELRRRPRARARRRRAGAAARASAASSSPTRSGVARERGRDGWAGRCSPATSGC